MGDGLSDALDGATDQDKLGTLALVTLAGHTDVFPSEKVLDLADILDEDALDAEPDVVSGESLSEGLVVHLHELELRLDLSGQLDRGEGHEESRLQDASLYSAHGHCATGLSFLVLGLGGVLLTAALDARLEHGEEREGDVQPLVLSLVVEAAAVAADEGVGVESEVLELVHSVRVGHLILLSLSEMPVWSFFPG